MPINRVTIVGNLTRDPELRGLPSGGSVCSLRVAVNNRRKDQASGQWVDEPNYFNVTIFGNSADAAARFLAKGRQVAVDGRLRWREWQDQQGNKREAIEIVAQDVQFIGGRDGAPGGGGGQGGNWAGQQGGGGAPAGDDWAPAAPAAPAGGGFNGPGNAYPVDQGDFGGPPAAQPAPQQNWGGAPQQPPAGAPAPGGNSAPPADDDIPF
ncbi:Single-stranded DNA-binding protein [Patulibacter medicamentivorans]|uniref:Single-stranded DNA-binding protein n=1 Tax=Patulibacter medicamentivorans TaxID=1097667 RepID=H0E9H1_9ACTN|nr:single-stranded DNA-binding protein [Patulibacter medicamentivorans]EHN09663.1 Single-stranded DNA-binding protein [Patulibacter medicamentivorans]